MRWPCGNDGCSRRGAMGQNECCLPCSMSSGHSRSCEMLYLADLHEKEKSDV